MDLLEVLEAGRKDVPGQIRLATESFSDSMKQLQVQMRVFERAALQVQKPVLMMGDFNAT